MEGDATYRDALVDGPTRGRGAGLNPANRFHSVRLHVLGEHLDAASEAGPRQVATREETDASREVLNRVDSPDIPFKWTVNPYRGCEHGCVYCYARPTHEYLGYSCGVDFETRIVVKHEAPEQLRQALGRRGWAWEPIVFSGVTDPYQPLEEELRITRRCLEVCAELDQPVSVITKSRLVVRDLDLLSAMARKSLARVAVSLTTLDNHLSATMEPRASSPSARLDAISKLSRAGVPVAVMTAPIIPAINDHEIPALLEAAAKAGARSAGYIVLRLPHQLRELFMDWLRRNFPARADKVESLIRQMRGGELYQSRPGERMRGVGAWAEQIAATHALFARRYGLGTPLAPLRRREAPKHHEQLGLFGE